VSIWTKTRRGRARPQRYLLLQLRRILFHALLHPCARLGGVLLDGFFVLEELLDGVRLGDVAAFFDGGAGGLGASVCGFVLAGEGWLGGGTVPCALPML
jgi:hypothetical protein